MPTFSRQHLEEAARRIFAAAGCGPAEAGIMARSLVRANLVGHDSHGVIRIPQYLESVARGRAVPGASADVLAETPASACLDGNWGFGQPIAHRATQIGVTKAKQCGVAAVTVRRANHMGRMGEYVEAAAAQGAIGLLFCNIHGTAACTVPWGGREPRLGTNPVAASLPRPPGWSLVLDMATSAVAEGKVRVLRNRGERTPVGWILDGEGRPTTDPEAFYEAGNHGSLLPFGGGAGHKGYGLSVVVDLLAGALSGAGATSGRDGRFGNAIFLLVLDVAQFVPLDEFARAVSQFEAFLKSSAPAPGYREVLVPGEVEQRCAEARGAAGIYVEEETWAQVLAGAERVGARLPDCQVPDYQAPGDQVPGEA